MEKNLVDKLREPSTIRGLLIAFGLLVVLVADGKTEFWLLILTGGVYAAYEIIRKDSAQNAVDFLEDKIKRLQDLINAIKRK